MLAATLWLLAAAPAAPAAPAACATDCRTGGGFAKPVLYYVVYNTTEEACCAICSKNTTCSFSIHDVENGGCWLSPPTASDWRPNPVLSTCRKSGAPPWPPTPPPPAPPSPPPAVALWPAPRGPATAGAGRATFAHDFAVHCAGSGCPSSAALGWYRRCASLALSPLPLILSYKSEKSLCGAAASRPRRRRTRLCWRAIGSLGGSGALRHPQGA